jgi:phage major head subunit gpT-like protein
MNDFLQKISSFFNFVEFKIFREGVKNTLLAFLGTLSNISNWIEERIFNQLINEGTSTVGLRLGNMLLKQEDTLDRPRVIIFTSVLFFSTFIIWMFG